MTMTIMIINSCTKAYIVSSGIDVYLCDRSRLSPVSLGESLGLINKEAAM